MTLILGIDPGSQKTGFGIIAYSAGRSEYITSGVIRLPKAPLPERLKIIHDSIGEIVSQHQPRELAIEEVFMARDAKAAIKLGQARGAAIVACVNSGMPVFEYAAKSIKLAVVGSGGAEKSQVQHMVKTLLKLPATPAEDAADALAAAICHAHTRQDLVRRAGSRRRR
jgi:crossover junction endodeoxyribonuclease RuvC